MIAWTIILAMTVKRKQVDSRTRLELKSVPEGGRENTVI